MTCACGHSSCSLPAPRGGVARLAVGLLRFYRGWVSPWLHALAGPGAGCRFQPTCSLYAIEAVSRHGAAQGTWLTLRRLVRCGPWSRGGYDPVPLPPGRADSQAPSPAPSLSPFPTDA